MYTQHNCSEIMALTIVKLKLGTAAIASSYNGFYAKFEIVCKLSDLLGGFSFFVFIRCIFLCKSFFEFSGRLCLNFGEGVLQLKN